MWCISTRKSQDLAAVIMLKASEDLLNMSYKAYKVHLEDWRRPNFPGLLGYHGLSYIPLGSMPYGASTMVY